MVELAREAGGERYCLGYAGDSFNTAVYLARGGVQVSYLTRLGDDPHSDGIIAALAEEGIDSGLVARDAGRSVGLYLIDNDAAGERQFSYWRENSPARSLFDAKPALPVPDLFYFTGITLAVARSGVEILGEVLSQLRSAGARVAFDPNYRPLLWQSVQQARDHYRMVLPLCDLVLPTLDDDRALWGFESAGESQAFYSGFGAGEVVVKGDALVASSWQSGELRERQAEPVAAIDTTGAGDSFNAGYIAARLAGEAPEDALARAQALAAEVVQHRGAIMPREQVTG